MNGDIKPKIREIVYNDPKACPLKFVGYNSTGKSQMSENDPVEANLPTKKKTITAADLAFGINANIRQAIPNKNWKLNKFNLRPYLFKV